MPPQGDPRILVVDDQLEMARLLSDQLADAGFTVEIAGGGEEALAAVQGRPFDLVLTDLRMQDKDGFDVLAGVKAEAPDMPVIIMTAFGAIDSAIEAIKRGAYHYLTKPFRIEEVLLFVRRALDERRLVEENAKLRKVIEERPGFAGMIGRSEPMRVLYDLIDRIAPSSAPVLIQGESGAGKELVARALHFQGARRQGPFVPINCTTLPEALLESELFGHLRGSYTGATTARRGLFVEADGSTLFLDEIGDMAPGLQSKLLRVLEESRMEQAIQMDLYVEQLRGEDADGVLRGPVPFRSHAQVELMMMHFSSFETTLLEQAISADLSRQR